MIRKIPLIKKKIFELKTFHFNYNHNNHNHNHNHNHNNSNSNNHNHNHNHNRNNINKTLNRVKRTTIQLHALVILSVNANPTNWNNEPLAESFNARAQGFF